MKLKKNKRGISIMIGYVLLVSVMIIIGLIVYQWMKTYVPKEPLECPDGVSIYIKDVFCEDNETLKLNLIFKNNGRFDINGYFIYATNDSEQELATIDLSKYLISGGIKSANSVRFEKGVLEPGEEIEQIFDIEKTEINQIYSIEIIPTRFQIKDNKKRFVSCGNAKVSEVVNIGVGGGEIPCEPDCEGKVCGKDKCGGNCPPGCEVGEICEEGVCVQEIITEIIDSVGDAGSSIALDSKGIVHVSGYDKINKNLKYCNNSGGSWNCINVSNQISYALYSSIAIDDRDIVHISYHTGGVLSDGNLTYCNNFGGSWSCVDIAEANHGFYSSIAIDSKNVVHISHQTTRPFDKLNYCNNSGGTWSCIDADADNGAGGYTSIAIDSNNVVHIAEEYFGLDADLRYCNKLGGSWNCVVVETGGGGEWVGEYSSIAIDSKNVVHISHFDNTNNMLRYCNNYGGSWNCDSIETSGGYSSIAIDSIDKIHIVHWDETNKQIRRCDNQKGDWDCMSLTNTGESFGYYGVGDRWLAIKKGRLVDTTSFSDYVHMSWYNSTTKNLMYTKYKYN